MMEYATAKTPDWADTARCCNPTCDQPAVWDIVYGPSSDDTTLSCPDCVAVLLAGVPLLGIDRIRKPDPDHLHVVFDGPPAAESGRFVEVEGSYGPVPFRGGVNAGQWSEREDGMWELTIPVAAGSVWG